RISQHDAWFMLCLQESQKSFAHAKSSARLNCLAEQHSIARRKDNDGRAVFEPAHLFAFAKSGITWEIGRFARIKDGIGKAQTNACDENRGDRNKRDEFNCPCKAGANNGAFVAAEKLLNP